MEHLSYNKLYYNAVNFIGVDDGVNPHFICPNCKFEWEPKYKVIAQAPAIFDFNEQITFKCPKCDIAISLYVALHKDSTIETICISVEPIETGWWIQTERQR